MSDTVFLTGATGFVGSHILRELLAAGYRVRALARPGSSDALRQAQGDNSEIRSSGGSGDNGVEFVEGDVLRCGELVRAIDGCRYVVHAAALYSFAPHDRAVIRAVNVGGTHGVMTAAYVAGVERVILTSSSATIGHEREGRPADESCYPDNAVDTPQNTSDYHHSKLEQERAAFAGRVPVVAVLPTAPVGPGDWKPTPTGKMIRDFDLGRITARAPGNGGLNLVAVEDVARAHVAALERGCVGERYVVGGENLSMDAIWSALAQITGKPMPSWRAPYPLVLAAAYADELRCRCIPGAPPNVPLEGVRMSRERMYADSSKAHLELGYTPTDVRVALERAVAWYRERPQS